MKQLLYVIDRSSFADVSDICIRPIQPHVSPSFTDASGGSGQSSPLRSRYRSARSSPAKPHLTG